MTPGELVQVMGKVLGIPEATVAVHDRYLRAAGLRSKAGRGRGAARVTARDAARLLTAILGSGEVRHAVHSVKRYSETCPQRWASTKKLFSKIGIAELAALPTDHSFVDALEAMLGSAATGSLAAWLTAEAKRARRARVRIAPLIEVAPLIEIALLTPGTVGDIRIAGVKKGVTAAVRYALPDPWDKPGAKKPSGDAIDAWAAKVKMRRTDADLKQYRRISARTILRVAQALSADQESE
jgi:hypothetical protein